MRPQYTAYLIGTEPTLAEVTPARRAVTIGQGFPRPVPLSVKALQHGVPVDIGVSHRVACHTELPQLRDDARSSKALLSTAANHHRSEAPIIDQPLADQFRQHRLDAARREAFGPQPLRQLGPPVLAPRKLSDTGRADFSGEGIRGQGPLSSTLSGRSVAPTAVLAAASVFSRTRASISAASSGRSRNSFFTLSLP